MSKKQTRRTYTTEFKLDVVNQSENCDNISKLATDLGLHPQLVYRWRAEYKSDPKRSFSGKGVEKQTPQEKKIASLKRALKNKELTKKITGIWKDSAKTYGSPRIHRQLLADGEQLSRPRVARLMKKAGMASQIRPKWVTTTDSGHALPVAPNLLGRDFQADHLARAWVSDITYLPSSEGWLYLTNLADRQIIGWSLADSMEAGATTIAAWNQACTRRPPGEELLLHSDQGVQYACSGFTELLEAEQVTQSMSRKGNCWDNAPAESFFKTLKAELPTDTSGCSYSQVRQALFAYIDIWYNRKRLHSSLDYQTPAQIEQFLTQQSVAA